MSISSEMPPPIASPKPHPSSAALGFAPGSLIADRYRVIALLGQGGMGEVYSADDLKLGQRVALKFLPSDRLKSSSWRDQFYAEVRMARQVSHPNVCRMYDVGESDGRLFLSMEFVDGEDLASLLRRIGRLPDDKAAEVAQQLCAGLAAAHSSGVLHRDLKPSNVMLDGRGRARITDFGLAIGATDADREKSPAGTPGYLAPELLSGGRPSVQSDLYALGLIFYELFTGKRAFEGVSLAELHRKQTETNPTPPSSVVKNFDPAVERAILRCLDCDPTQRPRSAHAVAAALPGGDPLAAALAAGETPSPDMVAAAGPEGSLRPAVAWTCLAASLVLIVGTSMFLTPHTTDWGLAPMPKAPEVLADRAHELAGKLGYASAVDHADWIGTDLDYISYASAHPSNKDWKRTAAGQVWPSAVSFWYRQSPQWMEPASALTNGPPHVTDGDPPFETSGMVAIRLDMQGNLRFLRAVPAQVEAESSNRQPDWSLLFAEAGLDQTRFASASSKWTPPDAFDSRADWEGRLPDHPDLPLHVAAAAFHGIPVYFQVMAPWDKPWRSSPPSQIGTTAATAIVGTTLLIGVVVLGALFARQNLRRGRGDTRGALRLMAFTTVLNCIWSISTYHFVPSAGLIFVQFILLAIPLLFSLTVGMGYIAIEPSARRSWPKLMVSWQRLLGARLRDPLVGRDVLIGMLAGAVATVIIMGANAAVGIAETWPVRDSFGLGPWTALGVSLWRPSEACIYAMTWLALLTIATGILRKHWLALGVTGLIMIVQYSSFSAIDLFLTVLFVSFFMIVLVRFGLIATVCFVIVSLSIGTSPPLSFSQWYAGRAMIALSVPIALSLYGFYVSLGGQPVFGKELED
jgi:serine/threonine-protein kinase